MNFLVREGFASREVCFVVGGCFWFSLLGDGESMLKWIEIGAVVTL